MPIALNHVAFVVSDLGVAASLAALGLAVGPAETFPSEGTTEVYVGADGRAGRLLLMRPDTDEGPYASARRRRGPGLHHVALDVPDLDAFVADRLAGTGWLLHPISLQTRARTATIWLARPGVGALIEVHETKRAVAGAAVVEGVRIRGLASTPPLARLFRGAEVPVVDGEEGAVLVGGQALTFR